MTGENHNRKFFNSERCYCSSPLAHSCWIIFFFLLFFWLHKSVKSPCRHQGFDLKTSWQVRFNYASFCMSSIPRNEIITQLGFTSTELMLGLWCHCIYYLTYLVQFFLTTVHSNGTVPCNNTRLPCKFEKQRFKHHVASQDFSKLFKVLFQKRLIAHENCSLPE